MAGAYAIGAYMSSRHNQLGDIDVINLTCALSTNDTIIDEFH